MKKLVSRIRQGFCVGTGEETQWQLANPDLAGKWPLSDGGGGKLLPPLSTSSLA